MDYSPYVGRNLILMRTSALLLFFLVALQSFAQPAQEENNLAPKVFVDCESCDIENLRQDFYFLHYVRDRLLCDVHVLVTTRPTGAGGTEFTLSFFGRNQFDGMNDTIVSSIPPNSTPDEIRDHLNNNIQLGLIRYIMKTPLCQHISINYDQEAPANDTIKDKWNFWVFKAAAGGWFNGESLVSSLSLNGSLTANRITNESKTRIEGSTYYNKNTFHIDDTTEIVSLFRNYYANINQVWSISKHWSAGTEINYYSSIYENIKSSYYAGASLEYDIFPYNESSTRMLYFSYTLAPLYRKYNSTTILFRDEQYLMRQSLSFTSKFISKWGQFNSTVSWNNFLHDFSLNSLALYVYAQFRLFKGFSLELSGYYARIRNRINLPLESASQEEILLGQVQLPTSLSYWGSVGISYTFGSIYNNIVNPRLE